jgi:enoyl-CoA hydratase/carnithine racemase
MVSIVRAPSLWIRSRRGVITTRNDDLRIRPGRIVIDSAGGFGDPARAIHDALAAHPATKLATVEGECSSAALTILMACSSRFAMPNASFLVHASTILGPQTNDNWNLARSLDERETQMAQAIGINPATWAALRGEAEPFDAFTAEAIGLITDITGGDNVLPLFPQHDAYDEIEYPQTTEMSAEGLERWRRRTGQQE